ncbi:phosphatase PAP2 family protein [Tumebacillus sp. ITR2]|uniref:Phosphatase PAP2 family protein n=1 Tax=Tumebacillus amylolyticus TaxID=2801339 RepID=A0ABS1JAB0_9BACL|nr:phosphatase PAP2 family protein [Tumebacillus amylolyticus]MBL0387216.1 phosphatase PAP2 family protein [Tumebacillus amylolyticus]
MTMRRWMWPLLLLATGGVLYGITAVQNWGIGCILFILVALLGVQHDQKDIPWKRYLPLGFLALLFPFVMYNYAGSFWEHVAGWQTKSVHHIFKWNDLFNSIPFNDGSFLWVWQPDWLTRFIGWVYWYGFTLSFWACMIRSFFTKDVKKMLHYAFAGFVLQVPLILLFYNTVFLQEVWWVKGLPDMLNPWYRDYTQSEYLVWVQNCFPSMHTSMAFAMLLMAMREKSKAFRWIMGTYCTLIILSTLYLKIHWVLDVLAGMLFAYLVVKLADGILKLPNLLSRSKTKPSGLAHAQYAAAPEPIEKSTPSK